MALTFGRYNARSDWLRVRSKRSLYSRKAHGPITDYANFEKPGHKMSNQYHLVYGGSTRSASGSENWAVLPKRQDKSHFLRSLQK